MTRAERLLAPQWRRIALVCALLALAGLGTILWARIDAEQRRSDQRYSLATDEADKRGAAVSTLATDVRQLRAQIQAKGGTPVAPDPAQAVNNLPDRSQVPVPIPGPAGEPGQPGATGLPGTPGPTGPAGASGPTGASGADGQTGPPGPAGPAGAAGQDGTDGSNGRDGADGQPPAGWTYTTPDGVAYTCSPAADTSPQAPRYTCAPDPAAPAPTGSASSALGLAALFASATYRRL